MEIHLVGYTCGFHSGADFPASGTSETNPDLYSCVNNGTVVYVYKDSTGTTPALGNQVQIRDEDTGNFFRYCHMLHGSIKVNVGDKVTTNTLLGKMGNTGNSTGTHLHLELSTTLGWQCSSFKDPLEPLGIPNVRGTVVQYDGSVTPSETLKGIDVSENNGTIDWTKVKNSGIQFAIIRLGFFGDNSRRLDYKFEENYNGAKNAGLKIGFYVYSYGTTESKYIDAGHWTAESLENKQCDLGCYLDLEDGQISGLDKTTLTNYAISYYRILDEYEITAGTYANKSWYTTKLEVDRLLAYKIWLAEWRDGHHTADFRVDMWQYADNRSS